MSRWSRGGLGPALGPGRAPVTWAVLGANVALWIALEATGGSRNPDNLYNWGAKFGPAILEGQWWRLVVPVFLHIGLFHLLANSIGLIIFGSTVETTFGSAAYAAIYVLSGVAGNIASFWTGPNPGAGASGAVFGIVGAFGAYLLLNRRLLGQVGRQSLSSIAFIVAINLLFGFTFAGIDNAAHVGGLTGGVLLGLALAPREKLVVPSHFYIGPAVVQAELRPRPARVAATVAAAAAVTALLAYGAYQTHLW